MTTPSKPAPAPAETSTAAQALAAAGDAESARDIGALDDAALGAQKKLGAVRTSLVERLIYGPAPELEELRGKSLVEERSKPIVEAALDCLRRGEAFTADGDISDELRQAVAAEKAYGFTVPVEFGGLGGTYGGLAVTEEELVANGFGALAVEISGVLTIGAGSLEGYGTDEQKRLFLPMIAEGRLMGFGLTEVKIGVNAKKVRAYVERDEATGGWRLFAHGDRSKLYITNACHGGLVGIVARIGETGRKVGLFVVPLPEADVERDADHDFAFSCRSANVDAFTQNYCSKITLENFPVPADHQIQGDGVEVLFYCLRMGRCMLAAMSAGYQRMFAADASHYAIQREGVGGQVIRHELPRLSIGKMLGGALQARALSHLSLEQDARGVDLSGLRDLTKSAAADAALESLIACERVLGGRSFDQDSRVSEARSNVHVFGVVEGENDLILMGMVKDLTGPFTDRYLAGLLSVLQALNQGPDGKPLPREQRILRITPMTFFKYPGRALAATARLVTRSGFWKLAGWIGANLVRDAVRLPARLLPTSAFGRYDQLPEELRHYARYAERHLRRQRWVYLGMNLFYQLELTRTQIPLQRFGKRIEHLVSMLALCHHVVGREPSLQRVAALRAELLRERAASLRLLRALPSMERLRGHVARVARDLEKGDETLVRGIEPQPFAHPWD